MKKKIAVLVAAAFVLLGCSGCGNMVAKTYGGTINIELPMNIIVSYTTRPMREGETEGKEYHFITEEKFKQMINNNQMLEYVQFNNWWYGTAISCLEDDKINIGIFNPSGIRALIKFQEIDLRIYYIHASDKQRLLRQLTREEYPDVREIIYFNKHYTFLCSIQVS